MREVLRECVKERIGTKIPIGDEKNNAVCLAIRLILCQYLGVPNQEDLRALLALQQHDGGFGVGWYYNFGKSKVKIGHRGYTATLAMEAIHRAVERKELIVQAQGASGAVKSWSTPGYLAWFKKYLLPVRGGSIKLM